MLRRSLGWLGLPDVRVTGSVSSVWDWCRLTDHSARVLPGGGVPGSSLLVRRRAMPARALWLVNAPIGWLRGDCEAWMPDGYWRKREPKPGVTPASQPLPPLPPTAGALPDA